MIEVSISPEAARQLVKVVELFGSAILPNHDLIKLVGQINESLAKEADNARKKNAERIRVQESAPQRRSLVRAVKRGQDYIA
jgi:hypothetical protein